jgi:hypothetical protein
MPEKDGENDNGEQEQQNTNHFFIIRIALYKRNAQFLYSLREELSKGDSWLHLFWNLFLQKFEDGLVTLLIGLKQD